MRGEGNGDAVSEYTILLFAATKWLADWMSQVKGAVSVETCTRTHAECTKYKIPSS